MLLSSLGRAERLDIKEDKMESVSGGGILAICIALQIVGNVAWGYKDSVIGIFYKEKSPKCWDLCAYSDEVNQYAKYIDELIVIRDQLKAFGKDFYFPEKKVSEFDREIEFATKKLHEKIGEESLKLPIREAKP